MSPFNRFFSHGFFSEETIVFSVPFSFNNKNLGIQISCRGKSLKDDSILISSIHCAQKLNFSLIQIFSVFFILVLSGTVLAQSGEDKINIVMPTDARVMRLDVKIGQWVYAGNILAVLKDSKGSKFKLRSGVSGRIEYFKLQVHKQYAEGEIIGVLRAAPVIMEKVDSGTSVDTLPSFEQMFQNLFK